VGGGVVLLVWDPFEAYRRHADENPGRSRWAVSYCLPPAGGILAGAALGATAGTLLPSSGEVQIIAVGVLAVALLADFLLLAHLRVPKPPPPLPDLYPEPARPPGMATAHAPAPTWLGWQVRF
jgi:hypothetical protein